MSLNFYMDHNVHSAITQGLRDRGVDCLTAFEDKTSEAADDAILQRALELNRVVFSQDTDFLIISTQWIRAGRSFAGVIFGGQMRVTIGRAIDDLELYAKVMSPDEMKNTISHLPL